MSVTRRLFGGAITANTAPDLLDASDFRQVPDNQEVFMYPHSIVSIIFEVLQAVDEQDDSKAARFHFDSVAHDNDAELSQVEEINVVPHERDDSTPSPIVLRGTQTVRKFNHKELDTIQILMALYRVKDRKADLVVTFNIPIESEDPGVATEVQVQRVIDDFKEVVKSLEIKDFNLFA
ncbi:hypothetical protein Agabi119p4_3552 [Agaricus bisporus var. burnettii]|uniref:Mog1p/PsbP-like protein n=1 Tax=Agaricus bisporus var. burnettii TaxID=192524 RepID=A0A8H7F550_AGABI|nr:hypothetical protein Agabi119p4_3552 [Agaricus bisporus var. burnettii]